MPKAFKKDSVRTKERAFLDPRSFVSLDGHELLAGVDKSARRTEIFQRDKGMCQMCGGHASVSAYRLADAGEWRHLANEHNGFKRCDCMEGGEWAHHSCHFAADHPGVQLGKIPSLTENSEG
jgi:hypothetical protein